MNYRFLQQFYSFGSIEQTVHVWTIVRDRVQKALAMASLLPRTEIKGMSTMSSEGRVAGQVCTAVQSYWFYNHSEGPRQERFFPLEALALCKSEVNFFTFLNLVRLKEQEPMRVKVKSLKLLYLSLTNPRLYNDNVQEKLKMHVN